MDFKILSLEHFMTLADIYLGIVQFRDEFQKRFSQYSIYLHLSTQYFTGKKLFLENQNPARC